MTCAYVDAYVNPLAALTPLKAAPEALVKTLVVELGAFGRGYRINACRLPLIFNRMQTWQLLALRN